MVAAQAAHADHRRPIGSFDHMLLATNPSRVDGLHCKAVARAQQRPGDHKDNISGELYNHDRQFVANDNGKVNRNNYLSLCSLVWMEKAYTQMERERGSHNLIKFINFMTYSLFKYQAIETPLDSIWDTSLNPEGRAPSRLIQGKLLNL